jgi:3-oxoacyl-[acyl-carrier protein] reductase
MTILEKHLERLKGQTAWITGGRRIGRVVARALAEQGVHLVVSYRRSEKQARETAAEARALGVRALAVRADVSSRSSFSAALERVQAEFPHLDILVNLASVYRPVASGSVTAADFEEHFAAHVLGSFWPAQLLAPRMPPGAHIINIADVTSVGRMQRANLPYVVTKAAVAAMTRALALEYGPRGIFVNAIAPGAILAPEDFPPERWARIRERAPLKFPITDQEAVEQFALLVLHLALTANSGQVYALDPGQCW